MNQLFTVSYHIACCYQVTVAAGSDVEACSAVYDAVSVSHVPLTDSTLTQELVDIDDSKEVRE